MGESVTEITEDQVILLHAILNEADFAEVIVFRPLLMKVVMED